METEHKDPNLYNMWTIIKQVLVGKAVFSKKELNQTNSTQWKKKKEGFWDNFHYRFVTIRFGLGECNNVVSAPIELD